MLTAYDAMTASVFDEAGIPVMLVGDSMGNCHLGYDTTVPVTMDEMTMLSAAVVRGTRRALIVADLPFGSYQEPGPGAAHRPPGWSRSPGSARSSWRAASARCARSELLVEAGIPVMATSA